MNNKPTVLVANGLMNAGGTESLLMEMFRNKSGRINYILLIHYQDKIETGIYDDEIRSLGVTIKHIPSVGTLGVKGYVKRFGEIIKEIGHVDIVHSHINGNGGIISMAAKKAGVSVRICHCHADIHFTGSLANRIKETMALSILKGFIELYATDRWACSEAAWKRLFMPWHKHFVIDNMINPRKYITSGGQKEQAKKDIGLEKKFIIGSIGRVVPIKNYQLIINLLPHIPDATFVCYGRFDESKPYCKSLLDLANRLGVGDRVIFKGNSNKVAEDIKSFDVFVLPSFTEGFGMAALEAQAASIPTLVSSGVPTSIDIGIGLAKFLSIENIEEWISAIKDVIKNGTSEIDEQTIIEAFTNKGKDSVNGALEIENKYISLCR